VIEEWLKEDSNCWMAIATAFLQRNERSLAVTRVSGALKFLLRDGPPTAHSPTATAIARAGTANVSTSSPATAAALPTQLYL
jgi:hypothetical protein